MECQKNKCLVGRMGRGEQNQLDEISRRIVYQGVARSLSQLGYAPTWQQCKNKIKNLVQGYRKVRRSFSNLCISKDVINYLYGKFKDHNNVSGKVAMSFLYYNKLDAIRSTRAASLPVAVLNSCGNAVEPVV